MGKWLDLHQASKRARSSGLTAISILFIPVAAAFGEPDDGVDGSSLLELVRVTEEYVAMDI